jgi:HEAT repeat protein
MEELYDVRKDPWQVNNLAHDPSYAGELERLRALLETEMKHAGDLGLLPERELHERAQASAPMEIGRDAKLNPLDELLRAADLANQMNAKNVPQLIELLRAPDSAVRWWGAVGLRTLKEGESSAKGDLRAALKDRSPDVRIAVAETLVNLGDSTEAMSALEQALKSESVFTRLAALTTAQRLGALARPLLPTIQSEAASRRDPAHKDASDYVARMVGYLPEKLTQ